MSNRVHPTRDPAGDVIQALKPKPRMMRCERNNFEATAIKSINPQRVAVSLPR
jgi:hypothetical protein